MLRGDTSVAEAARKHGVTVAEVEDWRERFLSGAENALRSRPADEDGQKDREIKRLKQNVGAFVMDVDIGHPLGEGSVRVAACVSALCGRAHGHWAVDCVV